jgi:hypothetical protein
MAISLKIGYRDENLDSVLRPLQDTYDAKTAGESLLQENR